MIAAADDVAPIVSAIAGTLGLSPSAATLLALVFPAIAAALPLLLKLRKKNRILRALVLGIRDGGTQKGDPVRASIKSHAQAHGVESALDDVVKKTKAATPAAKESA